MRREKLTPDRIRRFSCPDGAKQAFLWDSEAPRLAVRATAGAKSFVFEAKLNRKTIRRTIGDVQSWSIPNARVEARRLTTLVDQGIDPREQEREEQRRREEAQAAREREVQLAEQRSRYTLQALCDAYVRMLSAKGKRKGAADARSSFKCHILQADPALASKPAAEVTPREMAQLIRNVREAGKERAAGVLRSYLSAAYNAAKRAPFDSTLPAELIPFGVEHNPTTDIPAIPINRGNRVLSSEELRAYYLSLGDELADQALKLGLLAGGQRMAQLLRAKVSDFNSETGVLRLWDSKGKRSAPREHLLPLGEAGVRLVSALIERAWNVVRDLRMDEKDPWIFSSSGSVAMDPATPCKRLAAISAALGGNPFTLRDIRRTVETMLAELRVTRDVRAQLLSHGISGVQMAHYDRHDYLQEKHQALELWEKRVVSGPASPSTGTVPESPKVIRLAGTS